MINWRWVATVVVALFIMRVGGIISNFWFGLGVAGFVLILALAQNLLVLRKTAITALFLWAGFTFGIPGFQLVFQREFPILSVAITRRSIDREFTAAEWINPVALRARLGTARYCELVENVQTDWMLNQLEDDVPSVGGSSIPKPSTKMRRVAQWLEVIESHRTECRKIVAPLQPVSVSGESSGDWRGSVQDWFVKNRRHTLWAIVAILIVSTIAAFVTGRDQFVKLGMILASIIFWAIVIDWWIYDQKMSISAPRTEPAPVVRTISLDWCNERIRSAKDGEEVECKFGLSPGEEAGPLVVTRGDWAFCFNERDIGYHEVFCTTTRGKNFRGLPDASNVCVADLRIRTYNSRLYNFVVHKGVLSGLEHPGKILCAGRPIV